MKQHSTKIFQDIVNGLGAFIQSQFVSQQPTQSAPAGLYGGGSLFWHVSYYMAMEGSAVKSASAL